MVTDRQTLKDGPDLIFDEFTHRLRTLIADRKLKAVIATCYQVYFCSVQAQIYRRKDFYKPVVVFYRPDAKKT